MTSETNHLDWDLSSDESELTDLSDDEDEAEQPAPSPPKPPPRKTRAQTKKEYTIACTLKPPRSTQYATEWICKQIADASIILDPDYQRDVVWPETKQVGLIDSLLRNYYIPPVIFVVRTDPATGAEVRTCVDGKQRLTSIFKFMNGEIYHKDGNKKYWFQPAKGSRRILLPANYIKAFSNKQIICVEYDELNHDQEREIFQRVQLGVPLTPAERMQAICGPWPDLVREIQVLHFNEDGFGSNIDWDRTRGRDFSCIASILHLIHHDGGGKMAFPGTPQVEKLLQQTDVIPEQKKNDIMQTFEILCRLVKDKALCACFKAPARVSPVEMIMTGYLIYRQRNALSFSGLSHVIEKMRENVRKNHADVRANGTVAKTMWTYIGKISKMRGLPTDDILPASQRLGLEAREALLAKSEVTTTTRMTKIPKKRKLADTDTESTSKSKKSDTDSEPPSKMRKCETPPVDEQKAKRTGSGVTVSKRTASTSGTVKKPAAAPKGSSSATEDVKNSKTASVSVSVSAAASASGSATTSSRAKAKPKTEPTTQTARRKSAAARRVVMSPSSPEVARTQTPKPAAQKREPRAALSKDRLASLRAAQAEIGSSSGVHNATSVGQGPSASAGPSRPSATPQPAPDRAASLASVSRSSVPPRVLTPQATLPAASSTQSTQHASTQSVMPASIHGPPYGSTWTTLSSGPQPVTRPRTPIAYNPNPYMHNPNLTAIPPPDPRRPLPLAVQTARYPDSDASRSIPSPLTEYTPSPRLLPSDLCLPPYDEQAPRHSPNPNPNYPNSTAATSGPPPTHHRPPLSTHSTSSSSGISLMSISPALPTKPLPTPPADVNWQGKASMKATPIAPPSAPRAMTQTQCPRDRDAGRGGYRRNVSPRREYGPYSSERDRERERHDPEPRTRGGGNGAYVGGGRRY